MALKGLCSGARNEHIKLYLDNTTAIKYLSKMGGRKAELNLLTREIRLWCIQRNLILSVYHIPGILKVHSDRLSRQKLNIDMEWMLNRAVFDSIMRHYGMCEVDLFASSQNYQMIPYVSYIPDRNAMAINAFSLNWADYYVIFLVLSVPMEPFCRKQKSQKQMQIWWHHYSQPSLCFRNYYK